MQHHSQYRECAARGGQEEKRQTEIREAPQARQELEQMPKRNGDSDAIGVLRELEDIKRLLILALLRDGVGQGDIAKALGVSQPTISRMFPGKIGAASKRTAPR